MGVKTLGNSLGNESKHTIRNIKKLKSVQLYREQTYIRLYSCNIANTNKKSLIWKLPG